MPKHQWTDKVEFKTAKQLLDERKKAKIWDMHLCVYPRCQAVCFHDERYCFTHKQKVLSTPTPNKKNNNRKERHIDNSQYDR